MDTVFAQLYRSAPSVPQSDSRSIKPAVIHFHFFKGESGQEAARVIRCLPKAVADREIAAGKLVRHRRSAKQSTCQANLEEDDGSAGEKPSGAAKGQIDTDIPPTKNTHSATPRRRALVIGSRDVAIDAPPQKPATVKTKPQAHVDDIAPLAKRIIGTSTLNGGIPAKTARAIVKTKPPADDDIPLPLAKPAKVAALALSIQLALPPTTKKNVSPAVSAATTPPINITSSDDVLEFSVPKVALQTCQRRGGALQLQQSSRLIYPRQTMISSSRLPRQHRRGSRSTAVHLIIISHCCCPNLWDLETH
jgi:hypothetical protein